MQTLRRCSVVDVQKREDALLEKIHDLTTKRDDTLRQMDLWREAYPSLVEIMNDLELRLR